MFLTSNLVSLIVPAAHQLFNLPRSILGKVMNGCFHQERSTGCRNYGLVGHREVKPEPVNLLT